MLQIVVDHKLRLPVRGLPAEILENIQEALTIPNKEKEAARSQNLWGWQGLPDFLYLWDMDDDYLILPRGFSASLFDGLSRSGYDHGDLALIDHRAWEELPVIGEGFGPKPWQIPAIQSIITHKQGIYQAPAGSGKTATVLLTIRELGCKSLIIVNTKDIVWQWQERVEQFMGPDYPVGQVGDGIFDVSPYITIATAQTLHSRFEDLEREGFFDEFSFVCLDECHHATAETYNRILDRFSGRYRIGVSATPDKTGDFRLATNVLGPVFHVTTEDQVDNLIRPEIIRVPTDFFYPFAPTRSRWQRSNYGKMVTALTQDPERNELIVRKVLENSGHHQLVLSKRLEHLDVLAQMLIDAGFIDQLLKITGKESNEERQRAKEIAETQPCVLLSTLADEAMDIPRLDRLHLTFPQRNSGLVTQQVGRVARVHPEKQDALVFDYADLKISVLEKHWRIRRFEVYEPRGYPVALRPSDGLQQTL